MTESDLALATEIGKLTDKVNQQAAEINRLNQMLREYGYGQGEIDGYVAQCEIVDGQAAEIERLREGEVAADAKIERLKKLIQEQDAMLGRKPCQYNRCMKYAEQAAEIERLNGSWISVAASLPDNDRYVYFTFWSGKRYWVGVGAYKNGKWFSYNEQIEGQNQRLVHYWMDIAPLPDPPEEEQQ